METLGHEVVPIDVGPRSPDLSLLGIKASSHIMNVTDSAAFRALCEKENPTHIFHAAHPPRDETPTVLNYCYHAMQYFRSGEGSQDPTRRLFQLRVDLRPTAKTGRQPGQRRRRGDDLSHLFLPRREEVFEWMGNFYKEKHGVDFVALRYSSVYGPGLYRSIPLELKKGILGHACRPFLTRPLDDLIYIDDVADAVRRALFADKPLSRAYNIGLDKAYASEDLVRAIGNALPDLKFEIGQHPNAAEVAPHRLRSPLDISLAKRELGWAPTIYLEEGIARLTQWLKEHKAELR